MKQYTAKYFNAPYYASKEFGWEQTDGYEYGAADTESNLYYDGEKITSDRATQIYEANSELWFKSNVECRVWAFSLAVSDATFIFTDINDFMTAVCMLKIKTVVWYNARFDFPVFDYYFATNGWERAVITGKTEHIGDKHFTDMIGTMGQRYQMTIWKSYINSRHTRVHRFKMIDLMNVLPGGLRRLLGEWDVKDADGNEIRKLDMDYDVGNIENDSDYIVNDTKGLFWLAAAFDKMAFDLTGLGYIHGDFLTAGGLAIKELLNIMYEKGKAKANRAMFQDAFPMTADQDTYYRKQKLYLGGLCTVNPAYVGETVRNVYKYDINSAYPFQMYTMKYPCGEPFTRDTISDDTDIIQIVHITEMIGTLKPGKVPIWHTRNGDYDLDDKYVSEINETDICVFKEEIDEIEKWYDVRIEYDHVICYNAQESPKIKAYIDKYYGIKKESKGTKRSFAKLMLNSAYGKFGEKKEKPDCQMVMRPGGYMALEQGEITVDPSKILSVVVASYITCLERVYLMKNIRMICNENVAENFVYCDTDSIHALTRMEFTDAGALGAFKNEGVEGRPYMATCYLAPKTYCMIDEKYETGAPDTVLVHTGGVNTKIVEKLLTNEKEYNKMIMWFKGDHDVYTLQGMNVIGGRALVSIPKRLSSNRR